MPYTKEQIRELKDAVTPLESVEWLLDHGYPIEVKGLGKKYIDIKCPNPEHTDHTLGSCKISTGKYDSRPGSTCYCYACNKRMDSLDILKQFLSFSDCLQVMSEISGMETTLKTKKFKKFSTIPEKTRNVLEFPYMSHYLYVPERYTDVKPKDTYYQEEQEGKYLIMKRESWNPWEDLDAEAKSFLLREKAKEQMSRLSGLCTLILHTENLDTELAEFINGLDKTEFVKFLEKQFQSCQKIYRSNGGKLTDLRKLKKNINRNYWQELTAEVELQKEIS